MDKMRARQALLQGDIGALGQLVRATSDSTASCIMHLASLCFVCRCGNLISDRSMQCTQAKGTQVASLEAPQEKWDPFRHGPPKKQEKVRPSVSVGGRVDGEEEERNESPYALALISHVQVRIAAAFYDTTSGETVTTQDATRTHKRKHHINSLAIQAAEREAELLEGRSRGMLTKAQTQGKYGW